MEKRILQFIVFVLLLFVGFRYWHPFWRYDLNEAVNAGNTEKVVFTIDKGSSAKEIAENLYDKNLIVSDISFVRDVEAKELSEKLRYGSFVLSPSMTLTDIVTVLTTEGTGTMALTVPEGFTVDQIDARLAEMGLTKAGEFKSETFNGTFTYDFLTGKQTTHQITGLEGYLFPDTYFIDDATFTIDGLINQMLDNFQKKVSTIKGYDPAKLTNNLIIASMLEKEVRDTADLSTISGIIWKRFNEGWFLGIDATLLYIDTDGTLSADDLAADNPYNTRTQKGLPPTAICNPGLNALTAAYEPTDSEYYYYLTGTDGLMHYAKTEEEHEANKAQYLK